MKNDCFLLPARLVAALSLVVCAALVPNRAAADCVPPPSGLVGWWSGDGFALDLTTNQNNGTLGWYVPYVSGEVGQAFNFDGQDGFISIPDSPSLRPTNLTVEGWFNFTASSAAYASLVSKPVGSSSQDCSLFGVKTASFAPEPMGFPPLQRNITGLLRLGPGTTSPSPWTPHPAHQCST